MPHETLDDFSQPKPTETQSQEALTEQLLAIRAEAEANKETRHDAQTWRSLFLRNTLSTAFPESNSARFDAGGVRDSTTFDGDEFSGRTRLMHTMVGLAADGLEATHEDSGILSVSGKTTGFVKRLSTQMPGKVGKILSATSVLMEHCPSIVEKAENYVDTLTAQVVDSVLTRVDPTNNHKDNDFDLVARR
jgi:hypothetical protein